MVMSLFDRIRQWMDFKWFLKNYDALYDKYGKCYLSIRNRKVVGVYRTYAEGVKETKKRYRLGSFIVQYCNGDESGYTAYTY